MALIKCEECGAKISDKASACPKCGCPLSNNETKKESGIKFVAAKCPSCGANIDVDKDETKTKCKYCHTNIMVDEAIEKLKIEISGEIEVKNIPKLKALMENGARYYDNGEWDEAYKEYNKAVELDPTNYVAVLRNGICNTLDTNYFGYNLNPLEGGIKGAVKILGNDASDANYNQVAKEGYNATKLMVNFANRFFNKGLCDYKDMIDNQQKLLGCMSLYAVVESIARDNELKKQILKDQVSLAESLIASRKYRTGRYKNGNEVMGTYVPNKSIEKELYSLRNEAAEKYNKLVPANKAIKIKKQPAIRWDGPIGKAIIFIILFTIIFIWISSKFGGSDVGTTKYDYVQDCSGLQTVKLVDIYHEYQDNKDSAIEKYVGKAFIFEGKIFRIDSDKTMLQVDSEEISPEVYVNPNESSKLDNYKSGDTIKMCGIIKDKSTIISVPIYVENATIINN